MRTFIPLLTLLLAFPAAAAQDAPWPARSVRIVVPSSPGGGSDRYARLIAQALTESLKQPFVIDNRPGAAGNVGAELVARATPDGYTFLISANAALAINNSLYKNLGYDAERDFAPVARGVVAPRVFIRHPSLPVKTLAELTALGKREPGKLPYGTPGAGTSSHLTTRMFEEVSGARFIHVPYKGIGQALQGLLRGEVGFMVGDLSSVLPYIRAGTVIPLAVTDSTPHLPTTPTAAAAGYPSIGTYTSFSVVAPAATPAAIVQRMSTEIMRAMKSPGLKEKLESAGYIPVFDTPDDYAASLRKERLLWAEVIRRNNIVAD